MGGGERVVNDRFYRGPSVYFSDSKQYAKCATANLMQQINSKTRNKSTTRKYKYMHKEIKSKAKSTP